MHAARILRCQHVPVDLAQKEPPAVEAQLVEVLAFDSRNHLSLQGPTGCTATRCGRGRSAHVAEISHHDKRFTRLTPSETDNASRTVRGKQGSAACRPKACMSVVPCFVASRMTWSYGRHGPAGIPAAHRVIPGGTMHADQPREGIEKKGSEHVPIVAVKGEVAALSDSALFLFGQAPLQRCSCLEAGDEAQEHIWWWKGSGRGTTWFPQASSLTPSRARIDWCRACTDGLTGPLEFTAEITHAPSRSNEGF